MTKTIEPVEKTKSVFPIVNKIMAFLHLDEAGKIDRFFQRELKKAENAIRDLKNNQLAKTNMHESELQKLADRLEDAKEAVEFARQCITEDNVKNNESCEAFAPRYWQKIKEAELMVVSIENAKKDAIEAFDKWCEENDRQIKNYQKRIDQINNY